MPNYFADYDTTVEFISAEEMKANHSELPHGGVVMYSGRTGEKKHVIEYSLKLDSNPEFTGSVIAAVARAAYRMNKEGQTGAPPRKLACKWREGALDVSVSQHA